MSVTRIASVRERAHRCTPDEGLDRAARHEDLLEPIEVDERPHRRILEEALALLVDDRDLSHRHATREDPVRPRGDDDVARLQVLGALHELQTTSLTHRPLHDTPGSRALHDGVEATVVV